MKKTLTVSTVLLVCTLLFAHEYVLLAYKYKLNRGDTLEAHLFVSDGFNIQMERPLQKGITKKFELLTENGPTDLLANGTDGGLPILNRKVDFDGLGLLHIERNHARIALPTEKFLEYLKEDHLEGIVVNKDDPKKLQREKYSRYIKMLVQSGNKTNDLYKKVVGQDFEIVLLRNPYLLHKGDTIKAQVLFMGKPFANRIITARNRTGSENTLAFTAKTDVNGICSFKLLRQGEWFVHATNMIPCPDKTDSDWESFWASYSFYIGD